MACLSLDVVGFYLFHASALRIQTHYHTQIRGHLEWSTENTDSFGHFILGLFYHAIHHRTISSTLFGLFVCKTSGIAFFPMPFLGFCLFWSRLNKSTLVLQSKCVFALLRLTWCLMIASQSTRKSGFIGKRKDATCLNDTHCFNHRFTFLIFVNNFFSDVRSSHSQLRGHKSLMNEIQMSELWTNELKINDGFSHLH